MSLTTTEIGNVCLVCDAQRCGEALVSTVSQADVLATARASRWFVGTLHFCDRHAYLGGLANPTQTNAQLAASYAAAIAAPDLPTAAILRTELIARGAADQPVVTVAAAGIAPTTLTVDGQILTRAAGVPAAITRANLAADAAFTAAFATAAQGATADLAIPKATLTANGDILTRAAGIPALITRANLAADTAFSTVYAPVTTAGHIPQVDVYTSAMGATVWNKPSWAVTVAIHCIGGGGGGGSGRKGAAASVRCGGGGGGGGSYSYLEYAASDLPSTLTATAGAGGAGGASQATNSTDGNVGIGGTLSNVVNGSVTYCRANSGGAGGAGTATAGGAGAAGQGSFVGGGGGAASTTGLVGVAGGASSFGGAGAGSGGGVTSADVASAGGNGGVCNARITANTPTGGAISTVGQSAAAAGGPTIVSSPVCGHGGAGGGSSITTNAGGGGAGGFPGGGGGGGGSALDATGNSGVGGAAGNGLIVIITRG